MKFPPPLWGIIQIFELFLEDGGSIFLRNIYNNQQSKQRHNPVRI